MKPPQKKTTTIQTKKDKKKIKKNQKTDAAAAAETGGPLFSLAKAKTLMNDKVGSAVQFATTNVRPPSISVTNSNLSPAAIQQTALYVSSFLLVAYTSSRVRKNRRARAKASGTRNPPRRRPRATKATLDSSYRPKSRLLAVTRQPNLQNRENNNHHRRRCRQRTKRSKRRLGRSSKSERLWRRDDGE